MTNRRWLIVFILATLIAWYVGLGTHRAGAQYPIAQPILYEFTISGCIPCEQMQPILERLRAAGHDVQVIDCTQGVPSAWQPLGKLRFPTFVAVRGATILGRIEGKCTEQQLQELINRVPRLGRDHFRMRGEFDEAFLLQAQRRAEDCRRALAMEWLGHEIEGWSTPCDVELEQMAGRFTGGGSTSYAFNGGHAEQFTGKWMGTEQKLLDDIIPHEVLHTVLATHIRTYIPRWADEGAAMHAETTMDANGKFLEHLHAALQQGQVFSTHELLRMKEYPKNFQLFYGQSYSLAGFLIQSNGKRGFVAFIEQTLAEKSYVRALADHYGIGSVDELHSAWLAWVASGSPPSPLVTVAKPACCYQWRPLKRMWESRPGFIFPNRSRMQSQPQLAQQQPPAQSAAEAKDSGPLEAIPAKPESQPQIHLPAIEPNDQPHPGAIANGEAPPWNGTNAGSTGDDRNAAPQVSTPGVDQAPPGIVERAKGRVIEGAKAVALSTLEKWLIGLGPGGWAVFGAYKLYRWRKDKKSDQQWAASPAGTLVPSAKPSPACQCRRITEPAPPEPVYVDERHHVHVVEKPVSTTDRAWARAHELWANKYPGDANTVKAIEKLKEQILGGMS